MHALKGKPDFVRGPEEDENPRGPNSFADARNESRTARGFPAVRE